ncbi:MAG TPA: nickel-binding protein [Polyangiaceae bacterium]|jgi:hypothetical protein|nr:nickel-binding protein [Polyangiaceae bacterium]
MNSYVIFRRNAWCDEAALERAAGRSVQVCNEEMPERVRWLRTYVCEEDDGTLGSVCIFQAVDREALFEHARRSGIACDAVMPIVRTVTICEGLPR